ncbi:MAG: penicillin-binding protein activator LpoB, partial [Gemmataceae bacterium]
MDRREFVERVIGWSSLASLGLAGCCGHQRASVLKDCQKDMVGSHCAGAETFKPLVDEAVGKLLGRQCPEIVQVGHEEVPAGRKRICFVGVENKSAEEIGDFKDQLFEIIDTQIVESQAFEPISRRFVEAGLRQVRLRPDELFV